MEDIKLQVENRVGKGRHARNLLAKKGKIPGVIYGKEMGSMSVAVDALELEKIVNNFGTGRLVNLKFKDAEGESLQVMVKDLQQHPIRREVTHVDFQKINLHDKVKTTTRIRLVGEAEGVKKGGTVQQQLWNVEIECLPTAIPDNITVDVSALDLGESLYVSDLPATGGVEIATDPETLIATVVLPRAAEPEAVAEEGESAEADETEKAAADEGDKENNNKGA
ncbi:50S ribosomal protein L25/general stress protein Ctc [Desulfofalx alkaliphila]|uniref:50S ribosomal protein L25/general stress protein Ctc n=1 Tax=Desulfofalx alkaliphila TaxID=105483 RepID=UPI000689FC47|nr:50S ribosomal protein L25/general stress protein Ctc [Desulfofalx alkaliphila]